MIVSPLFVDTFRGDLGGRTAALMPQLLAAGPPWHGYIGKATEGEDWGQGSFLADAMRAAMATPRLGDDWFVGAYHYVHYTKDPTKQADFFVRTMAGAGMLRPDGTLKPGVLWPALDLERPDNPDAPASQIVDCVTKIAELVQARTGAMPTLYAGSLSYDKGITDHCGCGRLWTARYTATLPAVVYERIGWALNKLLLWQYDGDGEGYLAHYPLVSPIGKVDISALTIDGGLTELRSQLAR